MLRFTARFQQYAQQNPSISMTDWLSDSVFESISRGEGQPTHLTYWDLWLLMVLAQSFKGDWDLLDDHFRTKAKSGGFERGHAEGLLNHLRRLRRSLDEASLSAPDVLSRLDATLVKANKAKARRKVLELQFQEHERSRWMIETPRWLRKQRAMHGFWEYFPVSPAVFADSVSAIFKPGKLYEEDESFGLERRLTAFLERYEEELDQAGLFALYRAYLTVLLDKMNQVDDSYGVIGQGYESVFEAYYQLDRAELALPQEIFFQDLLELLIWEDYGFTHQKQPDFFASLADQDNPTVESILRQEWRELGELELTYQSENALTMLGLLYARQKLFDRYLEISRQMGTREWKRITRLSEAAEASGQNDLALAVYEASLGPGRHENYLREQYEKLKLRIQA
jgi:hypothetical protein